MAENKDIKKYSSLGVMGKPNGKKFTTMLGRSLYMYQEIDIESIDKAIKEEEERAEAAESALDAAIKAETTRAESEESTLYDQTYTLRKCLSETADWDELLDLFRGKAEGYQTLEQLIDTVYNFINTTDPDGMIDTFKELELFLSGLDESYKLADMFKALKEELTTEVNRAEEAELKLTDDLDAEIDRATEREDNLEDKINTAEQELTDSIAAEEKRAEEAEDNLLTAINNEATQRQTDVNNLMAEILNESVRAENAENAIQDNLDTETALREKDVAMLTNNLLAEIDRATSEEARLEALIKADEEELEDEIEAEAKAREEADTLLLANIDAEEARAKEAESTLQDNIDLLEKDIKDYYVGEDAIKVDDGTIRLQLKDGELFLINEDDGLSMNLDLVKITKDLEANVLEAYKLVDKDGILVGARIDIYKDALLLDVYLKDLQLTFEYELADGNTKIVEIPVHDFLYQAEFADGLQFSSDGIVSVKIDPRSEEYLTVSEDGVKFTGLDETKERVTNLESELAQEIVNREAADSNLQSTLESELSDTNNTLTLAIEDETTRATKAEEDLASSLTDAEDSLTKAIDTEVSRAESAESTLLTNIDTVQSNLDTAVSNLESEITSTVSGLDVSDSAVAGSVVIAVSETDGKIAVTRAAITSSDKSITLNDGSDGGIDISIPILTTSEVEEIFNSAWAV